ncbi:MAG: hypothetical protein IJH18_03675, partial [Bacilli bacterium]|nr:hypothetical protein [Bacilli bacterium]
STIIKEEISKEEFIVNESDLGTSFLKKEIFNASSALEELVKVNIDYIILNEDYIEHDKFIKMLAKTKEVLDNKKNYSDYQKEIESLIGNYTGFLYKDMIYRVKGNEKD